MVKPVKLSVPVEILCDKCGERMETVAGYQNEEWFTIVAKSCQCTTKKEE